MTSVFFTGLVVFSVLVWCSVASSSAASPQELALMVGRLAYRLPSGGFRPGFCSSFLTGIAPGTRIRFKLVSQPSFRLPFNPSAPVVMIAAGTGLAPFKVGKHWRPRHAFCCRLAKRCLHVTLSVVTMAKDCPWQCWCSNLLPVNDGYIRPCS